MKLHIKKGDTVIVNSGEFKGQKGTVLQVLVKKNRAIVEGVNVISKAVKPSAQNTEGGFVKKEAPIHISNLMLICPETGKPTRIGHAFLEDGRKVRVAKVSGEVVDLEKKQ